MNSPESEELEPKKCDCDVCQIWGEGMCEETDESFDPQDI